MTNPNVKHGRIKLSAIVAAEATDADIDFLAQLGLPYAYTWINDLAARVDELIALKERLAARGITLYNAGDYSVAKSYHIHLGTERRDEMIGKFADMVRAIGKAGIRYTTFTWEPDHVWSTPGGSTTRGGASCRLVDERQLEGEAMRHGRVYEKEELWGNFTYFMKKIIPIAEEAGVHLALHPNDPPMPMVGGVATLISSAADYRRAFSIAGSPMLGMEFCCGCWLEGGGFENILDCLREFIRDRRVFITHMRNVSAPMPYFLETFLDDGYMDIYELLRVFCEEDYDGTMIYDHTPIMTAGEQAAAAFEIGFIKATINAINHQRSR